MRLHFHRARNFKEEFQISKYAKELTDLIFTRQLTKGNLNLNDYILIF